MKISIASDLHLEFYRKDIMRLNREFDNKECSDILILAGDVAEIVNYYQFASFFISLSEMYKDIILIPGNHEFYMGDVQKSPQIVSKFLMNNLIHNIHFLNPGVISIGDIDFIGATLWTNQNNSDPGTLRNSANILNDYRLIKNNDVVLKPADTHLFHVAQRDWIAFQAGLSADNQRKCVVVTHHAPSEKSIHPRYQNSTLDNVNYYSDLTGLISDNPNISFWVHGHTHYPFDYQINDTRVVCNPLGYPGERTKFSVIQVEVLSV